VREEPSEAEADREEIDESDQAEEAEFLRNQRLNLYALAGGNASQEIGMSMGVNIGTYGY
jgi:uncharacterized protein YneR